MRIVSGRFRGLGLIGPEDDGPTRPTTDKVRGALFSILGDRVEGASFLDLYAGTGAVGIEAVSRGARRAVLVECHPKALAVIRRNLEKVAPCPEAELVASRVEKYLAAPPERFDVVWADPPFKDPPDRVLEPIFASRAAADGGLIAIEYRRIKGRPVEESAPPAPDGWVRGRTYAYGDSIVTFYSRDARP